MLTVCTHIYIHAERAISFLKAQQWFWEIGFLLLGTFTLHKWICILCNRINVFNVIWTLGSSPQSTRRDLGAQRGLLSSSLRTGPCGENALSRSHCEASTGPQGRVTDNLGATRTQWRLGNTPATLTILNFSPSVQIPTPTVFVYKSKQCAMCLLCVFLKTLNNHKNAS